MGLAGFERARREARAKAEALKPAEVKTEELKVEPKKRKKKEAFLDVLSDK